MRTAAVISATLHIAVFLIAWLGVLPSSKTDIAPAQVIDVEIATEIEKPKPKLVAEEKPKPPPPPPPAKRPPPPPEPQIAAKPEPEVVPIPKPEAVPVPKPKPKPKAKKEPPKPKKAVQRPRPKAKPKPPPKKAKPKPPPKHDFASVLKTVDKLKDKPPPKREAPKKKPKETLSPMQQVAAALNKKPQQPRPTLARSGISPREIDAIRRQIEPCWNLPAGARDADKMIVEIRATVGPDGRIRSATIVDRARASNDRFFRSMAESAVRAMLNPSCQPLRLPMDTYHLWRNMTLTFYPGEMF